MVALSSFCENEVAKKMPPFSREEDKRRKYIVMLRARCVHRLAPWLAARAAAAPPSQNESNVCQPPFERHGRMLPALQSEKSTLSVYAPSAFERGRKRKRLARKI